jgi:hypothetical protein
VYELRISTSGPKRPTLEPKFEKLALASLMSDAGRLRTSEAHVEDFVFAFTFLLPAATTIVVPPSTIAFARLLTEE